MLTLKIVLEKNWIKCFKSFTVELCNFVMRTELLTYTDYSAFSNPLSKLPIQEQTAPTPVPILHLSSNAQTIWTLHFQVT